MVEVRERAAWLLLLILLQAVATIVAQVCSQLRTADSQAIVRSSLMQKADLTPRAVWKHWLESQVLAEGFIQQFTSLYNGYSHIQTRGAQSHD
eukprot:4758851-Amphidinium_carterae.1